MLLPSPPLSCLVCLPQDEHSLLEGFAQSVLALDPDVLLGWEMQKESIGYLADRLVGASRERGRCRRRLPAIWQT